MKRFATNIGGGNVGYGNYLIEQIFNSDKSDDEKSDEIITLYQTHLRQQVEAHLNILHNMDSNAPDFEPKSNEINKQIGALQQEDDNLEQKKSYNVKIKPRKK